MKALSIILFLSFALSAKSQDNTIDERVIIQAISTNRAYGLKPKTTIKVGSIKNEYDFIAQLTGPNGEEIRARRLGSGWNVKSKNSPYGGKVPLDKWELIYDGLKDPIIIYLNAYDYEKPKCPAGLNFKKLN